MGCVWYMPLFHASKKQAVYRQGGRIVADIRFVYLTSVGLNIFAVIRACVGICRIYQPIFAI